MPTRVQVTAAVATGRPPKAVLACRVAGPALRTHSTHCCPTAASRRQSGQAWRPHRTQETQVSRSGCLKQVGGTSCPAGLAWSGAVMRGFRRPLAALDDDRLQHDVGHWTVAGDGLHTADLLDHVGAADYLAEDGVLAGEP